MTLQGKRYLLSSNGNLRDSQAIPAAPKRGIEGHRFGVTSNANIYFALIRGRTPLKRFFFEQENLTGRHVPSKLIIIFSI